MYDHPLPLLLSPSSAIDMIFSLFPFALLDLGWITNAVNRNQPATYDFIVIGGGNAYVVFFFCSTILLWDLTDDKSRGLAVASRLAEDSSITVALLEAGPNVEHLPEVWFRRPSFLSPHTYTQV